MNNNEGELPYAVPAQDDVLGPHFKMRAKEHSKAFPEPMICCLQRLSSLVGGYSFISGSSGLAEAMSTAGATDMFIPNDIDIYLSSKHVMQHWTMMGFADTRHLAPGRYDVLDLQYVAYQLAASMHGWGGVKIEGVTVRKIDTQYPPVLGRGCKAQGFVEFKVKILQLTGERITPKLQLIMIMQHQLLDLQDFERRIVEHYDINVVKGIVDLDRRIVRY